MTDEERLSAINETINKLRDEKTGLGSLKKLITDALKTEPKLIVAANQHILKTTGKEEYEPGEHLDAFIWCVLFKKIQKNEESHAKTPSEFKKTIGDEIKKIVEAIPKLSKEELEKTLENYDDKRDKLNATPEVFMKYGFSSSCSNGAGAFVHEFIKTVENILKSKNLAKEEIKAEIENIKKNDILFLETTKYTNLIDGHAGHVVPCVKLNTNNRIMIEARNETIQENVFTKEIPDSDMVVGKSFEHLIKKHKDEPYIIRGKSPENCTDHEDFLEHRSRVSLEDAKKFLAQVAKEEYWSPGMRKKIERELEILSNLSEEDKKLPPEELQCKIERQRRIQSLRLATEELGKQVQHGPYVSMAELKKAQEQQAIFDY